MKKCVVWGTGSCGRYLAYETKYVRSDYNVVAFCRSGAKSHSERIDDLPVLSPEELKTACFRKEIDSIIIGVNRKNYFEEISEIIMREFPDGIEIIDRDKIENDYLLYKRTTAHYNWNVEFYSQFQDWMNNFMSEVNFWVNEVANPKGGYNWDYVARLDNEDFLGLSIPYDENNLQFDTAFCSLENVIKGKDIVMDIGCGLVSKYGNKLPDGQRIDLLLVDPLAPFYNEINKKFAKGRIKECKFGMFEFISNFFARNYSDVIIINNALDHCIDPYKSLIECAYILKVSGKMYLNHRRAEALYNGYDGLHKWNMDYANKDFVIWNENNAVNVTKELKDIVDIEVVHPDSSTPREDQIIVIEITKMVDFEIERFIDMTKEREQLAMITSKLMDCIAKQNRDYLEISMR